MNNISSKIAKKYMGKQFIVFFQMLIINVFNAAYFHGKFLNVCRRC